MSHGAVHICVPSVILLLSRTGLVMLVFSRHAWEAVFHAHWNAPADHWCLPQSLLTLPCLQLHSLVLADYEGEKILQRSTGPAFPCLGESLRYPELKSTL